MYLSNYELPIQNRIVYYRPSYQINQINQVNLQVLQINIYKKKTRPVGGKTAPGHFC
uniref:Uncharacterized protein n=1 Tax=Arundo donax TaxID=35708 RepID=A0A0A9CGD2_ARUDO